MPRPPDLFSDAKGGAAKAPALDPAESALVTIAEHRDGILNGLSGHNIHFSALAALAAFNYDAVDTALEDIARANRGRAIDKTGGINDDFQHAVSVRARLVSQFGRADNAARVESVIGALVECGQKRWEGHPPGSARDFAVEALQGIARHHPGSEGRVKTALASLPGAT
jgi:hypothetical protein